MRLQPCLVLAFALTAASAATAPADKIEFKNGDVITGKIKGVEGGKMTIDSKLAGEIKVDTTDIKTFSTDQPVEIRTTAGERITAKAEPATQAGSVAVTTGTPPAARNVPVSNMKYVNFNESWTGAILGGAMFARGNTYADQVNVAFDLTRRTEIDRWTFGGQYNFGRERDPGTGDKTTTTDNYYLNGKYDYFLNEKLYVFGSVRYDHDRIAALDYRLTPGVGLGYQWVDTPTLFFNTEAGLAYVSEHFTDETSNDYVSARLAYHLKKAINDKVSFFHDLEYYPSLERLDDYLLIGDAGLRFTLTDRMFTEYKIEARYDSTPAEGASNSDLRHIVSLGWKF